MLPREAGRQTCNMRGVKLWQQMHVNELHVIETLVVSTTNKYNNINK